MFAELSDGEPCSEPDAASSPVHVEEDPMFASEKSEVGGEAEQQDPTTSFSDSARQSLPRVEADERERQEGDQAGPLEQRIQIDEDIQIEQHCVSPTECNTLLPLAPEQQALETPTECNSLLPLAPEEIGFRSSVTEQAEMRSSVTLASQEAHRWQSKSDSRIFIFLAKHGFRHVNDVRLTCFCMSSRRPLHIAVKDRDAAMIQLLLAAHADQSAIVSGQTALDLATSMAAKDQLAGKEASLAKVLSILGGQKYTE